MKIAVATLESLSPYSQSRRLPEKDKKEDWDAYENKHWRKRMHVTEDGFVFIPPMAFKRSLDTAASFLRENIKGKGQSEYGKHFLAGVMVMDGLVLPLKADDVEFERLDLSPSGKRGQIGVYRQMPKIPEWSGDVTYHVLDDIITEEVFERHLEEAGSFIGIGRFRPQNGGFYGRYRVVKVRWQ
jgi:hypothetical protein